MLRQTLIDRNKGSSTVREGETNKYRFKTDFVSNGSASRDNDGRPEFRYAAVFEGSSFWWRCATLPLKAHRVGGC